MEYVMLIWCGTEESALCYLENMTWILSAA